MNDDLHNSPFQTDPELDDTDLPAAASDRSDVSETVATVDTNLAIVAERVDWLTHWCERLTREHYALNEQINQLKTERDELRTKNGQLRGRIDAMVVRLKGLGQNS